MDAGAAGAAGRVLRHLRNPRSVVIISADVPWTHAPRADRFERPFAGRAKQSFATGTARLSRLSQRPVITCVPFLDEAGRVVLDWGEPIAPPPKEDRDAAGLSVYLHSYRLAENGLAWAPRCWVLSLQASDGRPDGVGPQVCYFEDGDEGVLARIADGVRLAEISIEPGSTDLVERH